MGDEYFWYHTEKDTVIDGENYKKIIKTDFPTMVCFFREDTTQKKVYMYRGNNTEKLLYDFSLNIGQSYISYDDDTLVLTNIDTINTLAGARRQYYFNNTLDSQLNMRVIEGVGSKEDPLLLSTWGGDPFNHIVCSYQNKVQIYNNPNFLCATDTFSLSLNNIALNDILVKVMYQPDGVLIIIHGNENVSKNQSLCLIDVFGNIIFRKTSFDNSLKIETNNLADGIYFYQIEVNKTIYSGKIFVK